MACLSLPESWNVDHWVLPCREVYQHGSGRAGIPQDHSLPVLLYRHMLELSAHLVACSMEIALGQGMAIIPMHILLLNNCTSWHLC